MSRLPVQRGDALQISSWNALASVRLTIRGLFHSEGRPPIALEFAHTPNTDRTIASTIHPLGDGELSHVTVFVAGAAPIIGQTFVRLQLVRGMASSGIVLATLAADYLTAVQPLAWPGSPIRRSVEGPGAIRSITGTDPAAGAEISETVPTGARWRLHALHLVLVTDATAASRRVLVTFDNGSSVYARFPLGIHATASDTWVITYGEGLTRFADLAQTLVAGLTSGNRLLAGHRIISITVNLQAADNYAAPQLLVEEWMEGAA